MMISSFLEESILKSVFIKVILGAINNVDSIRAHIPFIFGIKMKIWKENSLWKNSFQNGEMSDNDFLQLYFSKLMTYSTKKNQLRQSFGFCGHLYRFQQSFCDGL